MAAPFDANAVSIYSQFAQFELLTSGSHTDLNASASVLRMFASGSKLYYFAPGASGSSPLEVSTTGGGLDFTIQDGDGIADYTFGS